MIYTAWVDAPRLNTYLWDPASEHYMTAGSLNVFIGMEIVLLGLASAWFYLACRVAVRVVQGQGAEDVRSDGEDEDETEVECDGKAGSHVDVGRSVSGESTPSSISKGGSVPGTPSGVESLGVGSGGVHVPEVLKGLQCKRDFTREEVGARRRK